MQYLNPLCHDSAARNAVPKYPPAANPSNLSKVATVDAGNYPMKSTKNHGVGHQRPAIRWDHFSCDLRCLHDQKMSGTSRIAYL